MSDFGYTRAWPRSCHERKGMRKPLHIACSARRDDLTTPLIKATESQEFEKLEAASWPRSQTLFRFTAPVVGIPYCRTTSQRLGIYLQSALYSLHPFFNGNISPACLDDTDHILSISPPSDQLDRQPRNVLDPGFFACANKLFRRNRIGSLCKGLYIMFRSPPRSRQKACVYRICILRNVKPGAQTPGRHLAGCPTRRIKRSSVR